MSLTLRGKIYHYDFQYKGQRFQGSTFETTEKKAKVVEKHAKEEARLAMSTSDTEKAPALPPKIEIPTVGQLADAVGAAALLKRKSGKYYSTTIQYIARMLGANKPIVEINDEAVTLLILRESIKGYVWGQRRTSLDRTAEAALVEKGLLDPSELHSTLEVKQLSDHLANLQQLADDEEEDDETSGHWNGISHSTINTVILNPVFSIVNHARDVLGISWSTRPQRRNHSYPNTFRHRILTYEEEVRLKRAAGPGWPILEFAMESMLRKVAVQNLKWSNVDLIARTITMKTKGGKPFVRAINTPMKLILEQQLGLHPQSVFTRPDMDDWPGKPLALGDAPLPLTRYMLVTFFDKVRADAGIADLWFHDLRRTGATRLYDAHKDIQVVQNALGHSDPATTWRYIGHRPGQHEAAHLKREIMDEIKRARAQALVDNGTVPELSPGEEEVLLSLRLAAVTASPLQVRNVIQQFPELRGVAALELFPPRSGATDTSLPALGAAAPLGGKVAAHAKRPRMNQLWAPNEVGKLQPLTGSMSANKILHQYSSCPVVLMTEIGDLDAALQDGPIWLAAADAGVLIRNRAEAEDCAEENSYKFDHPLLGWVMALFEHHPGRFA
ncbi:MAG TPA: tyrosine-type recombinase/integrase [Ramlibacter sp.]|jgi:integrase